MKNWIKIIVMFLLFIVWLVDVFAPVILAIINWNVFYLLVYAVWWIPIFFGTVILFGVIRAIIDTI